MTERIVRVRLEGDSASLEGALKRSGKASTETTTALERTSTAIGKNKDAIGKFGTALKSAIPNAVALASSATSGTRAISGLASSVFAGAKAFGPWGLAIGVAGDAIVGYATAVDNAAEATRRLREEQRKESDERFERRRQEIRETQSKRADAIEANKAERRRLDLLQSQIDNGAELSAIEESLASHGRGKDTLALQKRETEIRAEYLRIQEDVAGAAELERDFHLHSLQVMEKKTAAAKKAKKAQAGFSMTPGAFIERDDSRDFAAGMRDRPALMRGAADPTESAANTLDEQMRAIEMQRATSGESIELINRERDARLELLAVQREASVFGAERAAIDQEVQQVHHEATLARIAQEQAAEEALMARRQSIMAATESIANSGVQLGNNIAKLSGANAKKREKIERGLGAGQAVVIGMLESVKAAAAFAQPFGIGIPEGLAHTAAAAVAFSTAAVLGSGAGGGGGGSAGGGASQFGGGTAQAPRSDPGNLGPIPGSPGPNTPSTGSSGKPSGSTMNNTFIISGVIGDRRAVMREIDEGLQELNHNRKPRRAG